jgi:hypothetical protein
MPRRLLLDNDGTNLFLLDLAEDVEASVAAAVAECPANVTTYMVCPNGPGKFYYPTKVGEVWEDAKLLVRAHAQGKDPFGMFLQGLRRAGKETFITYRMNDVHGADDPNYSGTAEFKKEHPDYIVDAQAVRERRADWMCYCLDYSRPEVREYILATMRELVTWYEVEGLQLDWMRFPRHLSGTPEAVWEKRGILTEFTAEARALTKGKMLLAARVPTNLAGCRRVGLDIAEWARQGLVDFLVATPFLTTDWWMPIEELHAELGAHPVPIYADIEHGHGPQAHCPESLRGAALSLYGCGADGLYLFNFACWNEYLVARPYHWLEGLEDPQGCAKKPLLFSVPHSMHRIAQVDLPGQLPVGVPAGEQVELALHVPAAAFPAWRAMFLVQSGGDLGLLVNGEEVPESPTPRRATIFAEYTLGWFAEHAPADEDCRVFRSGGEALRARANELTVVNRAGKDLEIKRVNVGLW